MRSFVKIKPSRMGDITLSITDIGKSSPLRDFYVANVSFNAFRENKILAKISEFTIVAVVFYFREIGPPTWTWVVSRHCLCFMPMVILRHLSVDILL